MPKNWNPSETVLAPDFKAGCSLVKGALYQAQFFLRQKQICDISDYNEIEEYLHSDERRAYGTPK